MRINPQALKEVFQLHDRLRTQFIQKPALRKHLIFDLDSTVLTVYGKLQGAKIGYNPHKRGRPSYHPVVCFEAHTRDCLNPDTDTYFTDLGVIYASQNLIKEALFAFDRALAINPRAINAMLNLGNLYANIGQLDTAIRIWEEALILEPDNENIKNNIKIARGLRKQ